MREPLFEQAWALFLGSEPNEPTADSGGTSVSDATDDERRLVMADWLDEQGDPVAAACLRWAVANGRSPNRCSLTGTFDWWRLLADRVGAGWKGETEDRYPTAGLPPRLYKHVYAVRDYTTVDNFVPSDTRLQAEVVLVAGWRAAVAAGDAPS